MEELNEETERTCKNFKTNKNIDYYYVQWNQIDIIQSLYDIQKENSR